MNFVFRRKVKGNAVPVHTMNTYRRKTHSFLTLALDQLEGLTSRSGRYIPGGKNSRYTLNRKLNEPQNV
jgi:hypothetical protein